MYTVYYMYAYNQIYVAWHVNIVIRMHDNYKHHWKHQSSARLGTDTKIATAS